MEENEREDFYQGIKRLKELIGTYPSVCFPEATTAIEKIAIAFDTLDRRMDEIKKIHRLKWELFGRKLREDRNGD